MPSRLSLPIHDFILIMHVCMRDVWVYASESVPTRTGRGHEIYLDLNHPMWLLGPEHGFSERTVHTPNHGAHSPARYLRF